MESIRQERRQHQRLAIIPLGVDGERVRVWAKQVRETGREADVIPLPVNPAANPLIYDTTSGDFGFMWGYDAVGSLPFGG